MENDRPDWVDSLISSAPTWQPPEGFAARVVARGHASGRLSWPVPALSRWQRVRLAAVDTFSTLVTTRIKGGVWMLRQYWSLLQPR